MQKQLLAFATVMVLGGCASAAQLPPPTVPPPPPCPVSSSSDWRATVSVMPGRNPTLTVTGTVNLPTPGWQPQWGHATTLTSYPVMMQIELDFKPTNDPAQAALIKSVRGSWPSSPEVGSVTIKCRGTVLAQISPVKTAL